MDRVKEFDLVLLDHITWIWKEKGVDQLIVSLIEDSYQKVIARVQINQKYTPPISIKARVKQGDAMPPPAIQYNNGSPII